MRGGSFISGTGDKERDYVTEAKVVSDQTLLKMEDIVKDAVMKAINIAVLAEREACAQIADKVCEESYDFGNSSTAGRIADLIRDRT